MFRIGQQYTGIGEIALRNLHYSCIFLTNPDISIAVLMDVCKIVRVDNRMLVGSRIMLHLTSLGIIYKQSVAISSNVISAVCALDSSEVTSLRHTESTIVNKFESLYIATFREQSQNAASVRHPVITIYLVEHQAIAHLQIGRFAEGHSLAIHHNDCRTSNDYPLILPNKVAADATHISELGRNYGLPHLLSLQIKYQHAIISGKKKTLVFPLIPEHEIAILNNLTEILIVICSQQSAVCKRPNMPIGIKSESLYPALGQTSVFLSIVSALKLTITISNMTNTSPTLVHPYSVFFSNEALEGFCRVARTIIISKVTTLQVVTGISECSSTNPHQLVFLIKMYGTHITYCIIAKGLQIHKRIAVISAESVRSTQPDITSFILNHIIDTIRRKSVTSSHASSCKHIFSCCPHCNQQAQ